MKSVTQQTYDQIASKFAQVNAVTPENVLAAAQKFRQSISPTGLCLDLGCGPGWHLAWFEQHRLRFIGVDFSAGMLAEARKVTACPLLQMDMRTLGFSDQVFEGIWCSASLLHLPKAEAPVALREMRRVLRAGGLLDLFLQQGSGEGLEVNPYTHDAQRYFARYTADEIAALLAETGFSVLERSSTPVSPRVWLQFVARAV